MPFYQGYITKSEENWFSALQQMQYYPRACNVAASRTYYSLFLLVKCVMVYNQDFPQKHDYEKMTDDATLGVHSIASQYIYYSHPNLHVEWKRLLAFRVLADYRNIDIDSISFKKAFDFWKNDRARWIQNLNNVNIRRLEV